MNSFKTQFKFSTCHAREWVMRTCCLLCFALMPQTWQGQAASRLHPPRRRAAATEIENHAFSGCFVADFTAPADATRIANRTFMIIARWHPPHFPPLLMRVALQGEMPWRYALQRARGGTSLGFPRTTVMINENTVPVVNDPAAIAVDESDMNGGNVSAAGQVTTAAGSGNGNITFEGTGGFNLNGLRYNGAAIQDGDVTYRNGVYTARVNGTDIFTLTIQADGNYTFRLLEAVDHPDAGDPDDSVQLSFDVRATDEDDDTDDGTITVNILDDGPTVNGDQVDLGADGGAVVAETIDGNFGQFEIDANGEYTYTLYDGVGMDVFAFAPTQGQSNMVNARGQAQSFIDSIDFPVAVPFDYLIENRNGANGRDITWINGASGSGIGTRGTGTANRDLPHLSDANKIGGSRDHIWVSFLDSPSENVVVRLADVDEANAGIDFLVVLSNRDGSLVEDVRGEYNVVTGRMWVRGGIPYQANIGSVENGVVNINLDASEFFDGLKIIGFQVSSTPNFDPITNTVLNMSYFLLGGVALVDKDDEAIRDRFTYDVRDGDGDTAEGAIYIEGSGRDITFEDVISTLDDAQQAVNGFVSRNIERVVSSGGAPLSIAEENAVAIYPNPVEETLRISIPKKISASEYIIQILDMNSRLLRSNKYKGGSSLEVDVRDLAAGVHFIVLKSKEKELKHRFIKQ